MNVERSPQALRASILARLREQATRQGIEVQRLQRRVSTERLLARLTEAQPGEWVLKGGMALEARLGAGARATSDVDLGLRMEPPEVDAAMDLLRAALAHPMSDGFAFALRTDRRVRVGDERDIARATVVCSLAGREWGQLRIDIGIRTHELGDTERLRLDGTLDFLGIEPPTIEAVSLPRHVAEKLHAMQQRFEDRENSRVKDLVDIVLLVDLGMVDIAATAAAVREVFTERTTAVPAVLPALPATWRDPYEENAQQYDIQPRSFTGAVAVAAALWVELISIQEAP